jgi:tRNA pseudouridine55 synthase
MARRKKGRAIHGWLVLDKPAGMTSTQAVGAVRRLFDARKAGHAGTLDPLATGVLPIALGEATKTVPYAVDGAKHYRFTVRWGTATNTDDAEGDVIATSELRPSRTAIENLLPRFTGEILQVPPAFSAIKIDGSRAYDLARSGEVVELEARRVAIDWLTLLATPDAATTSFEARCGKGTYVRALARDMGAMLGCHGHLIALRRTRVAPFDEAEAVSLAELEAAAAQGDAALRPLLRPSAAALQDLPELIVGPNDAARLLRGQAVLIRGRDAATTTGPAYATCRGQLIAVGRIEKGELHPLRVFNFSSPS